MVEFLLWLFDLAEVTDLFLTAPAASETVVLGLWFLEPPVEGVLKFGKKV